MAVGERERLITKQYLKIPGTLNLVEESYRGIVKQSSTEGSKVFARNFKQE